jgi:hypothetical protein
MQKAVSAAFTWPLVLGPESSSALTSVVFNVVQFEARRV